MSGPNARSAPKGAVETELAETRADGLERRVREMRRLANEIRR